MRWAISLSFMMTGMATAAAAQDVSAVTGGATVGITLAEAVRRAIDVQPLMVQARGDVRNAGAGKRAAFGAFLPSVTTSASTSRILGDPPTYIGGVSFALPLFEGFQRIADRNAAAATEDAADAGLINQRFQVTLNTKEIFYRTLATEELVRVAEAQVRRMEQQLQIAIQKLHAGSATRSDSLRAIVDHGNARIDLLEARAAFATAQADLGRQVGVDGQVRAVRDSQPPAFPDTTGLRAEVTRTAPSVVEAAAEARAAGARVTSTRSSYWPTLNTTLSGSSQGGDWPWVSTAQYSDNWSLRFGLSWTLFNGFSRERDLTQSTMARDFARARADDERRGASAAFTRELAALSTAYEQIDIARSNLTAATEDLRVQNERYRVGAATFLDLLVSQEAVTNAEVNFVQRRFDYVVARARLEALVGREL